ncbi:MAG: 50S ribosomal protein L11 methyltransferase [Vampirovibrionales bacterium]
MNSVSPPQSSPLPSVVDAYQRTCRLSDLIPAEAVVLLEESLWTLNHVVSVETLLAGHVGEEQPCGFCVTVLPEGRDELDDLAERTIEWLGPKQAQQVEWQITVPVATADWQDAWKQHWQMTQVSSRLWICPTWQRESLPSTQDSSITLVLDPGRAFGTGSHATTRLVLERLDALAHQHDFRQLTLMDVGCGSGVLSIAAALLGCRSVVALDVEPEAQEATLANAALNQVSQAITVTLVPLMERCLTPMDGIMMNIHAAVLLPLLPEAIKRLAPQGWLLLSGLLPSDIPSIEAVLEAEGAWVRHQAQQTDANGQTWVLLEAVKD